PSSRYSPAPLARCCVAPACVGSPSSFVDVRTFAAICLPSPLVRLPMTSNDRREFQRLHLAKPILAQFGDGSALILDIGIGGALIEHHGRVETGDQKRLQFRWKGEDISFECVVIRSRVVRDRPNLETVRAHTGIRFLEAQGRAEELLNDMMAT